MMDFGTPMDTYSDVENLNKYWQEGPLWKVWKSSKGKSILVTSGTGFVGQPFG